MMVLMFFILHLGSLQPLGRLRRAPLSDKLAVNHAADVDI